MLSEDPENGLHYHPDAYWCPDCRAFTLDCAHLVEPLDAPAVALRHSIAVEARWAAGVLQIRMSNGEGYQHADVPRVVAVQFVRAPDMALLRGYAFRRVRGRERPA